MAEGRGRVSARRPKSFSLLRQRKGLKRKATLLAATPPLCYGATCVGALAGWAAELTSLLRSFVQTTAASQFTKRLHPAVQPPPRQHPDPGASRREWGTTRAIAALGARCWVPQDSDRLPNSTEPAQTQVSSLTSESEKGKRRWGAPSWKAASAAATRPDVDRTSLHPGRAQRWPELDFPPLWTCREAQRVRRAVAPKDAHAS